MERRQILYFGVLWALILLQILLIGYLAEDQFTSKEGFYNVNLTSSDQLSRLYPADAELNYTYKRFNKSVVYDTNSLGFRDEEWSKTGDDNFTIVILGDSFTGGYGVKQSKTYPEQLESVFEENSCYSVQTINLGMGTYNLPEKVEALKEVGAHYHPNLVILQIWQDDFRNITLQNEIYEKRVNKSTSEHNSSLKRKIMLERRSKRKENMSRYKKKFLANPLDNMEEISEVLEFKVAAFDISKYNHFGREKVRKGIQKRGFDYLDLGEKFYELPPKRQLPGDVHPSSYGHKFIARNLYEYITESPKLQSQLGCELESQ